LLPYLKNCAASPRKTTLCWSTESGVPSIPRALSVHRLAHALTKYGHILLAEIIAEALLGPGR
jgi:hypothetical protein